MTHLPASSDAEAFALDNVSISYGQVLAVSDVTMPISRNRITTFIGPSGCGKTTVLRSLNRMNDLVANVHLEGRITFLGEDLYAAGSDPTAIRRRIGMVFQKPNVFPKSIYDNVAYGPRLHDKQLDLDAVVESCLTRTGLWKEVRNLLSKPAHELSGGQQQRLVIARALAIESEVLLMDEPCASLDPASTAAIEDLMLELAADHTIVLVTHNLKQAVRVSDHVAFFEAEHLGQEQRHGHLVEHGSAEQIFNRPVDRRTREYLSAS